MKAHYDAYAQIYLNIPEFERTKSFEFIESVSLEYSLHEANAIVADINADRETGLFTISFDRPRAVIAA